MINNKEFKKGDTVYFLKPVYALGSYEGIDFKDKELIFEIKKGEFVGVQPDSFAGTKYLILPEGLTELKKIPRDWVLSNKRHAKEECEIKNKISFQHLGKRVMDLESEVRELKNWAKCLSLKDN